MKLMNNTEFKKWLSSLLLIICGIIAYVSISHYETVFQWFERLFNYLSPFIAGFVLAYLLDIPCTFIEKKLIQTDNRLLIRKSRPISVFISFLIFIILLAAVMMLFIPEVISSTKEFIVNYQYYIQNFINALTNLTNDETIAETLGLNKFELALTLKSIVDAIGYKSIWDSIVSVFSVSTYLINVTIAIISSIYLLLEGKTIRGFFVKIICSFVPKKRADIIFKYTTHTHSYFKKFLYCNVVDGFIVSFASVIGLIIIDVRYAFLLGVVEGVLNMIPYFGAIVGTLIVVAVTMITDGIGKGLIVLLFLFILQQIDGNIIKVKLFGDSFQISPFLVIFSITIGGAYYGVLGMIIAIPLVAVLKIVLNDLLDLRLKLAMKKEE